MTININIKGINKGYNDDFLNLVYIKDLSMFYYYLKIIMTKYNKNDYKNFQCQLSNLLNDNRIKFIDYLTINSILLDLINDNDIDFIKNNNNDKVKNSIMTYKQLYYKKEFTFM